MRDVFGKEIEVGDYVLYFVSYRGNTEKAIVLDVRLGYATIEYLGVSTSAHGKKVGTKSKLSCKTTEKKIIVINSEPSNEKNIYLDGKKRFDEALRIKQNQLDKALKREALLMIENDKLKKEVGKIHYRYDILDFRKD